MRRFSLPVSLAGGLLAGLAVASAWSVVLRMIYQTPFGITDPVFSRDIGFYVFTLPGLAGLLGFLVRSCHHLAAASPPALRAPR